MFTTVFKDAVYHLRFNLIMTWWYLLSPWRHPHAKKKTQKENLIVTKHKSPESFPRMRHAHCSFSTIKSFTHLYTIVIMA